MMAGSLNSSRCTNMVRASAAFLLTLAAFGSAAKATGWSYPPTRVQDPKALERLMGNSGITLQWISFGGAGRGHADLSWERQTPLSKDRRILVLKGEQRAVNGDGRLAVEGHVVRIAKSGFILNGTIVIEDTPEAGRRCSRTGNWRFAVTPNRKYWRLRDFEWCDELTDYVDIYF